MVTEVNSKQEDLGQTNALIFATGGLKLNKTYDVIKFGEADDGCSSLCHFSKDDEF